MAFQQYPQKLGIPAGATAARPSNPVVGDTFYDGTLGFLLIWEGTQWIPCSAPAAQPTIAVTDVGTSIAYGSLQGSVAFTEGTAGGKAAGFTAVQGGFSTTGSSSTQVVSITGTPGNYVFSGTAFNGFGTSPQANSQTIALTSVPQAPTIGTATVSLTAPYPLITWTLGNSGGKNLSAITITPYLNGTTAETTRTAATTSSTSYQFTTGQLTAGASYTFTVKTTNANGTSLESSPTNSVIAREAASVEYVVIGGGGGAGGGESGAGDGGGGGGAGGYTTGTLNLARGVAYTIEIGAGGAGTAGGVSASFGASGGLSRIQNGGTTVGSLSMPGGGGGGANDGFGQNGGCGGGASGDTGTFGFGSNGGNGGAGGGNRSGGGGGGATANGASTTGGGNGGAGTTEPIKSLSIGGGGGGAGGGGVTGRGTGTNGGGNGGFNLGEAGSSGSANTGGGGGGGHSSNGGGAGGAGGSGVVILKSLTQASATTGSPVATTSGSFYIYQFNNVGSITY